MIKPKQHNKSGQTIVEYALIFCFIAVVAISVLIALGGTVKQEDKKHVQSVQKQVGHKVTVTDTNPPTVYYTDGVITGHMGYIEFYVNGHEIDISMSSKFTVEELDN